VCKSSKALCEKVQTEQYTKHGLAITPEALEAKCSETVQRCKGKTTKLKTETCDKYQISEDSLPDAEKAVLPPSAYTSSSSAYASSGSAYASSGSAYASSDSNESEEEEEQEEQENEEKAEQEDDEDKAIDREYRVLKRKELGEASSARLYHNMGQEVSLLQEDAQSDVERVPETLRTYDAVDAYSSAAGEVLSETKPLAHKPSTPVRTVRLAENDRKYINHNLAEVSLLQEAVQDDAVSGASDAYSSAVGGASDAYGSAAGNPYHNPSSLAYGITSLAMKGTVPGVETIFGSASYAKILCKKAQSSCNLDAQDCQVLLGTCMREAALVSKALCHPSLATTSGDAAELVQSYGSYSADMGINAAA
jgi:hypothetical protein